MSKFFYLAHVVSREEYQRVSLDDEYRDGVVVDGVAGLEADHLIITAHMKPDGA